MVPLLEEALNRLGGLNFFCRGLVGDGNGGDGGLACLPSWGSRFCERVNNNSIHTHQIAFARR